MTSRPTTPLQNRCTRHCTVGLHNGIVQWDCTVVLHSGIAQCGMVESKFRREQRTEFQCPIAQWDCTVGLHNGIAQWDCTVGLHSRIAQWDCTMGLHSGIGQWDCTIGLHSGIAQHLSNAHRHCTVFFCTGKVYYRCTSTPVERWPPDQQHNQQLTMGKTIDLSDLVLALFAFAEMTHLAVWKSALTYHFPRSCDVQNFFASGLKYCQALAPNPECWEGVPSPGGQWEEGHGVVQHVQGEHHQSSFLEHYRNANL